MRKYGMIFALLILLPSICCYAVNYALNFDGNDDAVTMNPINVGTVYTLEAWVLPGAATATDWFGILSDNALPEWGFSDDTLQLNLYQRVVGSSLTRYSWSHVAAVRNGNNYKLYINGVLDAEANVAGFGSDSFRVIGAYIYQDASILNREPLNGKLDEIRMWNVARTGDEIMSTMSRELTGTESGLLAYYNFNDGSGTTLLDLAQSNDGTLRNMASDAWVLSAAPVTAVPEPSGFLMLGMIAVVGGFFYKR